MHSLRVPTLMLSIGKTGGRTTETCAHIRINCGGFVVGFFWPVVFGFVMRHHRCNLQGSQSICTNIYCMPSILAETHT